MKKIDALQVRPIARRMIERWQGTEHSQLEDKLSIEEPFEIRVNGRSLAAIMRTPGGQEDRELAVGFLLSEGVISQPKQVLEIRRALDNDGLPEENVLEVELEGYDWNDEAHFERRFTVGSSCGLCGKSSITQVCRHFPSLPEDNLRIEPSLIYTLPDKLRQQQIIFESTGGLHAAALFDIQGNLLHLREDVGRHNAVDKLIGRSALDSNYPLPQQLLMVSGRASFEIVQKALVARIPLIAAVSAPSSLAVELAEESNLTLIGFLRGQSMNVYTAGQRVGTDYRNKCENI